MTTTLTPEQEQAREARVEHQLRLFDAVLSVPDSAEGTRWLAQHLACTVATALSTFTLGALQALDPQDADTPAKIEAAITATEQVAQRVAVLVQAGMAPTLRATLAEMGISTK